MTWRFRLSNWWGWRVRRNQWRVASLSFVCAADIHAADSSPEA